jgi:acetyl esterase/lipase
MIRIFLVTLGSLLLAGCQSALFGVVNARQPSTGAVIHANIAFDAPHGLSLDVYSPPNAAHAPVVVFFYGGSWKSGKRQWYRWVGEQLAAQGIVAVIPDYRQWPAVRLDGFMADGAAAVRWAHDHAADHGGDPAHLFLMGHSAGAHIAALLSTDARWLAAVGMTPKALSGFIGLAGPYDFLPLTNADFIDMFGHTAEAQARSQPVNFVDGDEPPALLLQGESDGTVRPSNALSLQKRYEAHGEEADVKLYPGLGHMGILFALGPWKDKAPVLSDAVTFIKGHSRGPL